MEARRAHNPKVVGSNPASATKRIRPLILKKLIARKERLIMTIVMINQINKQMCYKNSMSNFARSFFCKQRYCEQIHCDKASFASPVIEERNIT